jgi:hypothetical protein
MLAVQLTSADSESTNTTPAVSFRRFYSTTSFWNQPIAANAAIDLNSAAIVHASIVPHGRLAAFSNGDDWGIGLVYASPSDKTYTVACTLYYNTGPVSFKIPKGAKPTTGSDHHLVVIDQDHELDMWDAVYDESKDIWSAGGRFIGDLYGWGANAAPGKHAGGSVAAGYSGMGGVVRPEEIAQGHIDHALSLMVPAPKTGYVGPATATDGTSHNPYAIPEGARIQLDPSFDVDAQSWPSWKKTLAKALQNYGAYVSDTGGALAFYGQTDMNARNRTWASVGVPKNASLWDLPWSRVRVLDLNVVPAYP